MKLTDHIPVEGRMRHKQSLFPTNRFLEYFESHQSSTGRKNLSSITIRVAEKKKKELQGSSSWIRLYTWKVLFESEKHEKINLTTTKAEFPAMQILIFPVSKPMNHKVPSNKLNHNHCKETRWDHYQQHWYTYQNFRCIRTATQFPLTYKTMTLWPVLMGHH